MGLTAEGTELVGWGAGVLAIITVTFFDFLFVRNLALKSILCLKCAGLAHVMIARKSNKTNLNVVICLPLGPRTEIWVISKASAKMQNRPHVTRY